MCRVHALEESDALAIQQMIIAYQAFEQHMNSSTASSDSDVIVDALVFEHVATVMSLVNSSDNAKCREVMQLMREHAPSMQASFDVTMKALFMSSSSEQWSQSTAVLRRNPLLSQWTFFAITGTASSAIALLNKRASSSSTSSAQSEPFVPFFGADESDGTVTLCDHHYADNDMMMMKVTAIQTLGVDYSSNPITSMKRWMLSLQRMLGFDNTSDTLIAHDDAAESVVASTTCSRYDGTTMTVTVWGCAFSAAVMVMLGRSLLLLRRK